MSYICKIGMIGLLGILLVCCTMVYATGMAVGIDKLYLQNTSNQTISMHIDNLDKGSQNISIPANNICKIDKKVMFLPEDVESNSFVIMLQNANILNPIVIDKEGNLALASEAKLKFKFKGNVKYYNFLGYCDSKLQQSKLLAVIVTSDLYNSPLFNLKNCNATTNFVYVFNQNKQFKAQQNIDFSKVKLCAITL